MKERLKNIAQLIGGAFIMWMIVIAGLSELTGRTVGTLILGTVIVLVVFGIVYKYGDKLVSWSMKN